MRFLPVHVLPMIFNMRFRRFLNVTWPVIQKFGDWVFGMLRKGNVWPWHWLGWLGKRSAGRLCDHVRPWAVRLHPRKTHGIPAIPRFFFDRKFIEFKGLSWILEHYVWKDPEFFVIEINIKGLEFHDPTMDSWTFRLWRGRWEKPADPFLLECFDGRFDDMSLAGFVSCQTLGQRLEEACHSRCNFGKLRNHLNISFICKWCS